jgi:hypothetical protein
MGAVHQETLGQNRNCHEWEALSLSEINTIKSLIINRIEFDKFYEVKLYETQSVFSTNGVPQFYEIIEVTYLDLERLIKNARLSDQQRMIIKYVMRGYDYGWIGDKIGCTALNIENIFDTACEKIKEQNDFEWQEWIETSGQIKVEGEYKQCSKCQRWLKANEENFSPDKRNKDGFHSFCRQCR